MNESWASIVIAVLGSIGATWVGLAKFYAIRRENSRLTEDARANAEQRRMDAITKQDEWRASLEHRFRDELHEEIARLRDEIRAGHNESTDLRAQIRRMEMENGLMRKEVMALNIRTMQLETVLRMNGISVPDPPIDIVKVSQPSSLPDKP